MEFMKRSPCILPWQDSPLILEPEGQGPEGAGKAGRYRGGLPGGGGIEINMNLPLLHGGHGPAPVLAGLRMAAE